MSQCKQVAKQRAIKPPLFVGLALSASMVHSVPVDENDQPVDIVLFPNVTGGE